MSCDIIFFITWVMFFNKNHWLFLVISLFYVNNWNLENLIKRTQMTNMIEILI